MTSPVWDVEEDEGNLSRDAGDGTGEGYARYELSAEGESATIAINPLAKETLH